MNILYEDNHLIAVEKEAGTLTQGDYSGDISLIDMVKQYIKAKYGKPGDVFLGMIHRLDRPVSGIVLFARTSKAASRMSEQFRNGTIKKFYLALISGEQTGPGEWTTLSQYLVRGRGHSEAADTAGAGAQKVSLRYKILSSRRGVSLVLIRLVTGRKHQIRAQLSSVGMPVIGDIDYGSSFRVAAGGILLHACGLRFVHPTRKDSVFVSSPAPDRFDEYWRVGIDEKRLIADSIDEELELADNNIFDTDHTVE